MPKTQPLASFIATRFGPVACRDASESTCGGQPGPRVRPDLVVHELDGELLVYDPSRGDTHRLNESATMILRLCDGTHSQETISRHLLECYEADPPDVLREVERAVRAFRQLGLLEEQGRVVQP